MKIVKKNAKKKRYYIPLAQTTQDASFWPVFIIAAFSGSLKT